MPRKNVGGVRRLHLLEEAIAQVAREAYPVGRGFLTLNACRVVTTFQRKFETLGCREKLNRDGSEVLLDTDAIVFHASDPCDQMASAGAADFALYFMKCFRNAAIRPSSFVPLHIVSTSGPRRQLMV